MITTDLPEQGIVFWPVGTGDSTTIVVDDTHVVQVDIHDMVKAGDDDAIVAAVVDRLVDVLPKGSDGNPYLSLFVLTHADKDHCLGFADLLDRVTIGELWASPRLWREYEEEGLELCADAKAFHEEAERRVTATRRAVAKGNEPGSGDRIRIIGYDTNQPDYPYADLPPEYLSRPGDAITMVDGEDQVGSFEAFVHAPFKDDCAAARNDTSLALQITLTNDSGEQGQALLLGDLAHDTIMKIFDYSESHNRSERVAWHILLAPHHCSKKVMYVSENGRDVLKRDVLDAFEKHAFETATIVVSSAAFPYSNKPGDNPPHVQARNRYEEIVETVLCTGEDPTEDAPQPIVFGVEAAGLIRVAGETLEQESARFNKSLKEGRLFGVAGTLARLGGKFDYGSRLRRESSEQLGGLDRARQAISSARGDDAAPQQPVGFGQHGLDSA
jgi:beta-lactamase superfamily II metal-dependent hydrolase